MKAVSQCSCRTSLRPLHRHGPGGWSEAANGERQNITWKCGSRRSRNNRSALFALYPCNRGVDAKRALFQVAVLWFLFFPLQLLATVNVKNMFCNFFLYDAFRFSFHFIFFFPVLNAWQFFSPDARTQSPDSPSRWLQLFLVNTHKSPLIIMVGGGGGALCRSQTLYVCAVMSRPRLPCQDTHTRTYTHMRAQSSARPTCAFSAKFSPASLPFCPLPSPFRWRDATPQSATPDWCRNPWNLRETLAHKKPMIHKKLQKTLQPLLGNRLRLGPKGGWKIAAFAEGKRPRCATRSERVRSRGEVKTLCVPSRRCHCLSDRQMARRWVLCRSGILAQSTEWMLKFGMDIWNRSEDEPKWLQSYPVLEIISVSFSNNFQ